MDGQVSISIIQWGQLRDELAAHKEKVKKLEDEVA